AKYTNFGTLKYYLCMVFIRRVKTSSGAVAIQIAHKRYGRIVKIEHIGSAHSKEKEELLVALARQRLNLNQQSLFKEIADSSKLTLQSSSSVLLRQIILDKYRQLGFEELEDEIFSFLTVARIVEPVSKLDSLRVL